VLRLQSYQVSDFGCKAMNSGGILTKKKKRGASVSIPDRFLLWGVHELQY